MSHFCFDSTRLIIPKYLHVNVCESIYIGIFSLLFISFLTAEYFLQSFENRAYFFL
jgi:hypothetical protein